MAKLIELTALPKINFNLIKHFEDKGNGRELDVVYIHGLGGGPWKTWAHEADIEYFWPYWLQYESN